MWQKPQLIYPDIGFEIDIFGKIGHTDIKAIWFEFNENTDTEIEIQLEDKEHACLLGGSIMHQLL